MNGMATSNPSQDRLRVLDREIADWTAISADLSRVHSESAKEAVRSRWRVRYLRLASWVRSPSTTDSFFYIGALIGIVSTSLISFIAAEVLLGSVVSALVGLAAR